MSSLLRLFIWIHTIQCITSHWLDLAALPTSDSGMAVGSHVASRSIYLLGGNVGQTTLTKYSIDFNTFSTIEPTPLTSPLNSNSQFWTQQDDIVYMMSTLTSLAAFDLATLTYSESLTFVPQNPGVAPCLASSMDYLYVTGGSSQPDVLQVFQISTGQWTQPINRMITGRSQHSCVVHESWLYVFAGYDGSFLTSTECIYISDSQFRNRIWQDYVTLPQAVIYSRAISCGNQIFVLGGRISRSSYKPSNIAQIIDKLDETISVQYMPYAVYSMGTVCFEQDVYVFGGQSANSVFYYTEFTDDPTKSPTSATKYPTLRTRMPSVRPSEFPSRRPSNDPTVLPSNAPSKSPTIATETPSNIPTRSPSNRPSKPPTIETEPPSDDPTRFPSNIPSSSPSQVPTRLPSVVPSQTPTQIPSNAPSNVPTVTTIAPSIVPSNTPSVTPTIAPIKIETTDEEKKGKGGSHDDASANSGMFDGFSSTQVTLIVILIILTGVLFIVLIVMVVIKWKTDKQIQLDVENMEKQQRSIYGEQEGNDDDGTTVEDKNDNAFEGDLGKVRSEPNEDDILAQVLALSLAEEEEAREKEQMEMMKQIKIMKQIEEEQERKRQGQIESEQVKDHDDNAGSLPESVHESIHDSDTVSLPGSEHDSDDEVLKTDNITTGGNDGIVDEYKQDVEDVMDNPTSPNYNVKMVFNTGTMEQGGIELAGETDSDDDILVEADITMGAHAVVRNHVDGDEVMFGTGDLPESDNSDDDVLVGENIGTTRTGGGDGSIALPGQPTLGLNDEDQALPSTSTAQSGE
eukprot:1022284_1